MYQQIPLLQHTQHHTIRRRVSAKKPVRMALCHQQLLQVNEFTLFNFSFKNVKLCLIWFDLSCAAFSLQHFNQFVIIVVVNSKPIQFSIEFDDIFVCIFPHAFRVFLLNFML